jgi:hypothetical protein
LNAPKEPACAAMFSIKKERTAGYDKATRLSQ